MRAEEIGRVIRTSNDADLERRRKQDRWARRFAIADFLIGALYQTGVIRRIPDPKLRHVDSMGVMASAAGYPFGVPDTPIATRSIGSRSETMRDSLHALRAL